MTCKTFPICCWRRTRRQVVDEVSGSTRFEILRRLLAAVADQLVFDHLTFVERGQASALDRGDMNEYVFAAILRLNESIAFRRVEPFHGASSHLGLLCVRKRNRDRTTIVRSPIRSQRCLWEATPRGARQNKAKLEYRDCTRFSRGIQPHDVINKGSSSLGHFSARLTLVACADYLRPTGVLRRDRSRPHHEGHGLAPPGAVDVDVGIWVS